MTIAKRIAELESVQATREVAIARAVAEFRGGEAELASLKAGVALRGELTSLARTEAILSILRTKGSPLSPTEIVSSLTAAGRTDAVSYTHLGTGSRPFGVMLTLRFLSPLSGFGQGRSVISCSVTARSRQRLATPTRRV